MGPGRFIIIINFPPLTFVVRCTVNFDCLGLVNYELHISAIAIYMKSTRQAVGIEAAL